MAHSPTWATWIFDPGGPRPEKIPTWTTCWRNWNWLDTEVFQQYYTNPESWHGRERLSFRSWNCLLLEFQILRFWLFIDNIGSKFQQMNLNQNLRLKKPVTRKHPLYIIHFMIYYCILKKQKICLDSVNLMTKIWIGIHIKVIHIFDTYIFIKNSNFNMQRFFVHRNMYICYSESVEPVIPRNLYPVQRIRGIPKMNI